jgi:hypothetical protein
MLLSPKTPPRTSIKKNFKDIPGVGIPAFAEARAWMDKFCRGYIDPVEIARILKKGTALMNRRNDKRRPGHLLDMKAEATVVKRSSGLLVPPKYKD